MSFVVLTGNLENYNFNWCCFTVCEPPLFPVNGNVSVSTDGLTASYECDTGYILAGNTERSCLDDGSGWSGTEPSCSKSCCFLSF